MSRLQAESFPQMRLHRRSLAEETSAHTVLLELAGTLTPRVEAVDWQNKQEPSGTFVLDISGTRSLFGSPAQIAETARRKAADHGLEIQIAIAANFHAAVCAARGFRGITLFDAGKSQNVSLHCRLRCSTCRLKATRHFVFGEFIPVVN